MALLFGTGGIPLSAKGGNVEDGVRQIRKLGLDAMELEFVHSVFLDEKKAESLREVATSHNVILSVHGSYYINLASEDKQKWHASIKRVLDAAQIGNTAGAKYVTFHTGFRQKRENSKINPIIYSAIEKILEEVEKQNLKIKITPELTGKASQWGDLEELIQLVKEFDSSNLGFCFDFAHKHARNGGGYNSRKEFEEMLDLIKRELGAKFLKDMHIHISGINYSDKGERNHLTLIGDYKKYKEEGIDIPEIAGYYEKFEKKGKIGPADLKWRDLLQVLKDKQVGGIVVCESPNLEQDALLMKQTYENL